MTDRKQSDDVIVAAWVSNEEAQEIYGNWKAPKPHVRLGRQLQS